MAGDGLREELRGEVFAFLRRNHPSDDVTAEQIDNHVGVKEYPFLQCGELRALLMKTEPTSISGSVRSR